jgi:ribosomal protein S18 acetylase RimI-like enzyme
MIVRNIEAADFVHAERLLEQVYIGEGHTAAEHRRWLADVPGCAASPKTTTFVAEEGDALLGHVIVCRIGSPLAHLAGDGDAEVRLLATAPAARGRGIGEALVGACLDHARRSGCRRVVLSTQMTMEAAQRLYARLGFRRWPAADQTWDERRLLAYEIDL